MRSQISRTRSTDLNSCRLAFPAAALLLALAGIIGSLQAEPNQVQIVGIDTEFYRNGDHQPTLAIDGDDLTYSWITASGTVGNPYISTFVTLVPTPGIDRIRILQENWCTWGMLGGAISFNISWTADPTPSLSGTWTLVTGAANGYQNEELVRFAEGGGMNTAGWQVYREAQEYSDDWFSISFDRIDPNATGILVEWNRESPIAQEHWAVFEFEVYTGSDVGVDDEAMNSWSGLRRCWP